MLICIVKQRKYPFRNIKISVQEHGDYLSENASNLQPTGIESEDNAEFKILVLTPCKQ